MTKSYALQKTRDNLNTSARQTLGVLTRLKGFLTTAIHEVCCRRTIGVACRPMFWRWRWPVPTHLGPYIDGSSNNAALWRMERHRSEWRVGSWHIPTIIYRYVIHLTGLVLSAAACSSRNTVINLSIPSLLKELGRASVSNVYCSYHSAILFE
jgi:hypothetical protein